MKRCNVKPYDGNDNYIFVSYCHKDKAIVYPVIENMAREGYRIWYDEGIDPGSEWPEIIASHLNGCAVCIAFISNNSLNSHNCKREVSFAHLKKKDFISIITEPVKLTLGMEMQLSASQAIFKYTIESELEFYNKLYDAKFLEKCKGQEDLSIKVSNPSDYIICDDTIFTENELQRKPFSDKWFSDNNGEEKSEDTESKMVTDNVIYSEEKEHKPIYDSIADSVINNPESNRDNNSQMQDKTIIATEKGQKKDRKIQKQLEKEEFIQKENRLSYIIKRNKTGELFRIQKDRTVIGRSESMADIHINDNSTIGRVHALIVIHDNNCYLVDCNSKNKTRKNSITLIPEKEYKLSSKDVFQLSNELFTFEIEEHQI